MGDNPALPASTCEVHCAGDEPSEKTSESIELLDLYVSPWDLHRGNTTQHLSKPFPACPLWFLRITGAVFSLEHRSDLRTHFNTLSRRPASLCTTFQSCHFEPEPLHDLLSIRKTNADIIFLGCDTRRILLGGTSAGTLYITTRARSSVSRESKARRQANLSSSSIFPGFLPVSPG